MSATLREQIRIAAHKDETTLVGELVKAAALSETDRKQISDQAEQWIERLRRNTEPSLLESFLAEYGLSTQEGVALMCLAEALLRVPDTETIDDLIADKLAVSDWGSHSGKASSPLVNASTWALMLTGHVLSDAEDTGLVSALRDVMRRLGEPVVRVAVSQAMKELGEHFVLGETIEEALDNGADDRERGFTHSFDMLGEGARTDQDARRYHLAYADAITSIAKTCGESVYDNPGISVKLSALHPRFEATQQSRSFDTLLARARSLAVLAGASNIGFNIDAEESNRLEYSLDIIEELAQEPALRGWDGFGVVVQAYGRRALATVDWLADLADRNRRKIMVRLVKGAYWDTEIKRAQALGLSDYPVFTQKSATDISYAACARRLLQCTAVLYPQFATHNAHTVATLLHIGGARVDFELQRLHGMGASLHGLVKREHGKRSRIYAPVGVHRDLLAYLVRRLLENGANSSFVHQFVDVSIPARTIAQDPIKIFNPHRSPLPAPQAIYPGRVNSRGWDVDDPFERSSLEARLHKPVATTIDDSTSADVERAVQRAHEYRFAWADNPAAERCASLLAAAGRLENEAARLVQQLTFEAGKTRADAVSEIREAVDFLRYYAREASALPDKPIPLGTIACISPWNFPLAIFTGQVAAALAAGNCVVAKPAEQTPAIAQYVVSWLHQSGVPDGALQIVFGGAAVGAALTGNPQIDGVCFTGSLTTAQMIHRGLPTAQSVLIAETGGVNTMIVDSTALFEQAVRDVVSSAFQSAGQRCSALRMLYVQTDVAEGFLQMLCGAMDQLNVGNPQDIATDVGPVIDQSAFDDITDYLRTRHVYHQIEIDCDGLFIPPTLIEVAGIEAVEREVFGPVLHFATFEADEMGTIVDRINASGYALTGAIHTRLDDRVQYMIDRLHVGNLYVNRNQIGAVVESQPFGGERLSGTGPKAGGPNYLLRLTTRAPARFGAPADAESLPQWPAAVARGVLPARRREMPSVTGERNELSLHPRGTAWCLGPEAQTVLCQVLQAQWAGCKIVALACAGLPDTIPITLLSALPPPQELVELDDVDVVAYAGEVSLANAYHGALAQRPGAIVRLVTELWDPLAYCVERHVCIDTTAAGGNTTLLLEVSE